MKKTLMLPVFVSFTLITLMALSSCEKSTSDVLTNDALLKTDTLQDDCSSSLIFMREEEKLAHDVYYNFYETYQIPVFRNIARSEDFHTNSIKGLLDLYSLEDPFQEGIGNFTNPDLSALYLALMEQGAVSLESALRVGAAIEEIDIIDLEESMATCSTDTIVAVYTRLQNASGNHLRAFVRQLEFRGFEYTPQYLSAEEFEEIINGEHYTGGGNCDSTVTTISDAEALDLQFMREEEKLAHDVYVYMFRNWNTRVFDNISKSELQHTTQILRLLNQFQIADPASTEPGLFNNPELQSLYNQLIEQGLESNLEALKVGATIEEVDILDLIERLQHTTNPTIIRTYNNLEKASEAHLRAFVRVMASLDYNYEPQFLSPEEFERIMNN